MGESKPGARKLPPPAPHAPGGIFKRSTVPAMSRVDPRQAPSRTTLDPVTAPPPPFEDLEVDMGAPLDWLVEVAGVSGYVHVEADATSYASGGCPEGVEDQMQYLGHLADLVGLELGLGAVGEVHVQGASARLLHRRADAAATTVLTGPRTNTHQLVARWPSMNPASKP